MKPAFKGWRIVAASVITLTLTCGVGFYTYPHIEGALKEEFGWSLTQVSGAFLVWGLVGAVVSPLCGGWIDRFGARRVMLAAVIAQTFITLGVANVHALWQLYALFGLSAIASICSTYIPIAAVVAHWFDKNRGAATGIAMLGIGLGGAAMSQIGPAVLEVGDWRTLYYIAAGLVALSALPIALTLREPLTEEAQVIEAHEKPEVVDQAFWTEGLTLKQALRTRSFWGVGLGDALTGLVFAIFTAHLIVFLTNDGMSAEAASNVFGLFLFCLAFFTIVFGIIADHISLRKLVIASYLTPAFATLLLIPAGYAALPWVFAIVCGAFGGGRTALFPLMLGHCFGTAHLAAIYGLSNTLFLIGNALGPILAGGVYDTTHSTTWVYLMATSLFIISTLLVMLMRDEHHGAKAADF